MRLQLSVALVVASAAAHADTGFVSKIQVYSDTDHTQVISPVVEGHADVGADTNVSLGYLVDVVSSASVDLVSQASPREMHDTRHQVSLGATHVFDTITVGGGYSFSKENDYLSHTLDASVQDELFDKNTTLALGYGLSLNTVGRSGDLNFARSLTVQHVSATWTQLVSAKLATQVAYEIGDAEGFQSSPYRFVPVRSSLDAAPTEWVMETDPDSRWRHAIVVGANRSLGEGSVQGDYRLYFDNWGITSHTIGARYFVHLTKTLELRLRERFYTQDGASFYQSLYMAPTKYITYDRELSPLWSETFGAKLVVGLTAHLEGELKADLFYYSYSDFAPLTSRTGANLGVGVSVVY
jgi:hypothetical protein